MPDPPVLETLALTKYYGNARGVEAVSLAVERGEIFGFLGPNGAGKTTVIRSAMGFLRASSGEVRLFGDAVHTHSDLHHERLGYLPADLRLWSGLSARKISDLLLGISAGTANTRKRDELARRLELNLDRRVKSLSLGNRQKVGLMLALQHNPELVILDEPTSGLDPLVRREVIQLLREFAADGGTIVYSSHNLVEVEQICSRVGILRKGRLVALKTIDEVRAERAQRLEIVFGGSEFPAALPDDLSQFTLTKTEGRIWQVDFHGSPGPLLRWLSRYEIAELTSPPVTLEESFMGYYEGDLASPSVGGSA